MALVYLVTAPSGKQYVGWTSKTLSVRRGKHITEARGGGKTKFATAIRKYGEALVWSVLVENISDADAKEAECRYIAEFNTYNTGYNLTLGGEGVSGLKYSSAARLANQIKQKAVWACPVLRGRRVSFWARPGQRESLARGKKRLSDASACNVRFLRIFGAPEKDVGVWFDVTRSTVQIICRGSLGYGPGIEHRTSISEQHRKLSPVRIASVRMLLKAGATGRQCAEWFGVSEMVISNIKNFAQGYR